VTTTTEQYGTEAEQTGPQLVVLVAMFLLIWFGWKKANR
jgi:hypothetical protein